MIRYVLLGAMALAFALPASAQADKWTGIWKVSLKHYATAKPITMELHIGNPEQGVLYPATINIQYGEFTGQYEVLLARKNDHQLGIGRNKWPLRETPFKLGIWIWYLNGTFNYHHKTISLSRMWINKLGIWMRGLGENDYDDEIYTQSKVELRDFLYRDTIVMKPAGNKPLADSSAQRILKKKDTEIYFGIYDPITTTDSMLPMEIRDQEKYDKDTVTLVHNGRAIFSGTQINDSNRQFKVKLDTGRNLFVFFADNYGRLPPNTGMLYTKVNNKEYGFNFSDRPNAYATFMVADIYRNPKAREGNKPDTTNGTWPNVTTDNKPAAPVANKPELPIGNSTTITERKLTSQAARRTSTPVATLQVDTADILLEVGDVQIQDGDSISLSLNGKWIVTGFPVKKAVQQIPIKLKRGENRLLFMADNLGSIPPNTAQLRIRYGGKTEVLSLSTDMKKNNEIWLILP